MSDADIGNFFRVILTMTIAGSVLALVLFALKPFIKNRVSKAFQYYIWLIVIVQFLVPVSAKLPISHPGVAIVSENQTNESNYEMLFPQYNKPVYTVRDALNRYVFSTEEELDRVFNVADKTNFDSAAVRKAQNPLPINVIDLMMIFWPLGVIIFLASNLFSYYMFLSVLKKSLKETTIVADYSGKKIPVYKSTRFKTPMLVGIFKAKIILPDRDYEPTQLGNILLHETMHRCRFDLVIKWISTFANALHWFNPIAYIVRKEINHACELSCDEAIIKKLDDEGKQNYGDTLISVVAESRYSFGVVSTTMCEDKKKLKERLKSIMSYKKSTKTAVCLSAVLAVALILSAFTMNASSVTNSDKGVIRLESLKLSDMPTKAIVEQIAYITGATGDNIFVNNLFSYDFQITKNYEWDITNIFDIFVVINKKGEKIYTAYQIKIEAKSIEIKRFTEGPISQAVQHVKLITLLDALKNLPAGELNRLFKAIPSKYIVNTNTSMNNPEDNYPCVYYDRYGLTGEGEWSIGLDLIPLYPDGAGGFSRREDDSIHLFYTAP